MDSAELSNFIMDCAGRGISRLSFIVGGSFGIHNDVKRRAEIMLSMSKMTFPHNLARVMLLEQLYRAFQIAGGGKYHK
jgi:23S rRNA (pseudouridine1915-N3)-methyltransferase